MGGFNCLGQYLECFLLCQSWWWSSLAWSNSNFIILYVSGDAPWIDCSVKILIDYVCNFTSTHSFWFGSFFCISNGGKAESFRILFFFLHPFTLFNQNLLGSQAKLLCPGGWCCSCILLLVFVWCSFIGKGRQSTFGVGLCGYGCWNGGGGMHVLQLPAQLQYLLHIFQDILTLTGFVFGDLDSVILQPSCSVSR